MKPTLSVVVISQNSERVIANTLKSVQGWADEIVVVDGYSTDQTRTISEKYGAKVYLKKYQHEGRQKAFALSKAKSDWVLSLDTDEVVSTSLKKEIHMVLSSNRDGADSYIIPFQNHYLNRHLKYGGEDYKLLRLFKRKIAKVKKAQIHAPFDVGKAKVGELRNKILHYSYRSVPQLYGKFTGYALREAKTKQAKGERTSLKKIFLYPPHMFYARFVESQGYKDGLFRIPLDLGFAYMELLTYLALAYYNMKHK